MRDYAKFAPTFWTRGSGKRLRGHPEAQLVAAYLFSAPNSNMLGLYYLPLPMLAYETGLTPEQAERGLARVIAEGVAHYDRDAEIVWLPEGARIQIGPSLSPGDKRARGVEKELAPFGAHPFVQAFLHKYGEAFSVSIQGVEPKPLRSPFEAPSKPLPEVEEAPSKGWNEAQKPLRSQDQDQEQKQDQEQDEDEHAGPPGPPIAREVFGAYLSERERWVTGGVKPALTDKRAKAVRARVAEFDLETVKAAAVGIWRSEWHRREGQTGFDLAMRDAAHVERFAALGGSVDDDNQEDFLERAARLLNADNHGDA